MGISSFRHFLLSGRQKCTNLATVEFNLTLSDEENVYKSHSVRSECFVSYKTYVNPETEAHGREPGKGGTRRDCRCRK